MIDLTSDVYRTYVEEADRRARSWRSIYQGYWVGDTGMWNQVLPGNSPYIWTEDVADVVEKEPTVSTKCKECLAEVTLDNVEEFRRDKEGEWVHRHPSVCTTSLRVLVRAHEENQKSYTTRIAALEQALWGRSTFDYGYSSHSFEGRIKALEQKPVPRQKILGIF